VGCYFRAEVIDTNGSSESEPHEVRFVGKLALFSNHTRILTLVSYSHVPSLQT